MKKSGDTTPLLDQLCAEFQARDREMQDEHGRSLSLQDTLFDRWERARTLAFGTGSSIYNSALVYGDVSVGEGTWIGPYVVLEGNGGITIGAWCSISAGVHIYTHDSVRWALSGGEQEYQRAGVSIADRCYVGPQSIIAAGVNIGKCSVVAANSFVSRDIAPYTVVGGSPARIIGRVEFEEGVPDLVFDRNSDLESGPGVS